MGEEEVGNGPVNPANYTDRPGVMPVINDPHRVYKWWVNGNENFFYQGDSIALNAALEEFAKIESKRLELVLRPGPETATTFDGSQQFKVNWSLQLIGGIAAHIGNKDQGQYLWPSHPVLFVNIGGPIQLGELVIPEKITVVGLSELKERYKNGFKSENQDVRGWTCGRLAQLDRYDTNAMKAIEKMLSDESQWVRSNAVGALEHFAAKAKDSKASLEAAMKEADEALKKRIAETITKIELASGNPQAEHSHQQTLDAIDKFCARRKAKQ